MNENQLLKEFRNKVEERFNNKYEEFLHERGIPLRFVPRNALEKVVNKQMDFGFHEFVDEQKGEIKENNYTDKIDDYVAENYNDSYIYLQFEQVIKEEEIATKIKDELLSMLTTTDPYRNLPRSYWLTQVNKVRTLKELGRYVEDVEDFIITYAPEWEEILEENR